MQSNPEAVEHIERIKSFSEFLFESKSKSVQQFYLLVNRERTFLDTEVSKLLQKAYTIFFKRVNISFENYKALKFDKNVPILTFTVDGNLLIEKMIQEKIIDKKMVYNFPVDRSIVSDKVLFHERFKNSKFVPKTVFDIKDVSKLKFPIIAKPARGKSGEGIVKFKSQKDLEKSKDKFDLFSEMIEVEKEFRCFCFRDKIITIDERIDRDKKFLEDAATKTDFYYKKTENYEHMDKLNKVLEDCRSRVNLDFYSVDFAETKSGDLFIIEMNSQTGMSPEKTFELYKLIYKDCYKKDIPEETNRIGEKLVKQYLDVYSKMNECTTVSGKLDGTVFLFKNRDRSFTPDYRVIHEKIKETEVAYYTDQTGWVEGMNEHGVGFIFSDLTDVRYKGYEPTYTVSDEPKSDNFKDFVQEFKNLLCSKSLDSALKTLEKMKKRGSFLISDGKEVYEVEKFEGETKKRKIPLDEIYVKTNHGTMIKDAGHQPDGESIKRASTSIRRHQAYIQLQGAKSIGEIPTRMKFQAFDPQSPLNSFRTDNEEYTISQCLLDLTNLRFFFFFDKNTADSVKFEDKLKSGKIHVEIRK